MMEKKLDFIIQKQGSAYFTFLDLDETILLIQEYYRKYEKCEVDVHALSGIAGRGTNPDTGKPIISGLQAFSVTYNAGINKKTGKTIIREEWFDESRLEEKIKKLFRSYGYDIKEINFHTDLYLKSEENSEDKKEILISEEMAADYGSDKLGSTPVGMSILFTKKKTIFEEAVLSLKKINRKNEVKFDRI